MGFTNLDRVLWATGFLGHVVLLVVLVRRSRWREFPVFTALIAYQAMVTVILFAIYRYGSPHSYFVGYWQLALGDYCFQVALVFEMARVVFRSAGTSLRIASMAIAGWTAVCVLIFAGLSIAMSPPGVSGLDLWAMRATLFTSLLTCGLFVSISLAANYKGLPWRSHVIALGQGLAAWSAVAVVSDIVHIGTGWHRELAIFDHVRMYVYFAALLLWTLRFWAEEPKYASLSASPQHNIEALHRQIEFNLHRTSGMASRLHSSEKNEALARPIT
jgi:hypothetical protein